MNKCDIIDFEQLWESGIKCMKGVGWKPSVKSFELNQLERTLRIEERLNDGTWQNSKPKPVQIMYPKKREGMSIPFLDRVYQRSINDNELYPAMTRTFIYDNCACQTGKGPDFTINRLKTKLHNHVMKYGVEGYVLQIDIHGYYQHMRHEFVNSVFAKELDPDVLKMVIDVLDQQYSGDIGYNPGSQMVQIAGISALNELDHKCKEQMHMENYIRYMDDTIDINIDEGHLQYCFNEIKNDLLVNGFALNEKKSHITPLKNGFTFLGFDWKVTESSKVILTLNSENVRHERRKLRRMVNKAKRGEITKDKCDECLKAWEAHAGRGNSYNLITRMRKYYKELWNNDN